MGGHEATHQYGFIENTKRRQTGTAELASRPVPHTYPHDMSHDTSAGRQTHSRYAEGYQQLEEVVWGWWWEDAEMWGAMPMGSAPSAVHSEPHSALRDERISIIER